MIAVLALAVALATDTAGAKTTVHTAASPVAGPRYTATSWTHDVGHLVSLSVAAPSLSLWLKELGVARGRARWITVGTMAVAMVLKEVHDERVGIFSGRDLINGTVGLGVGMLIAERLW